MEDRQLATLLTELQLATLPSRICSPAGWCVYSQPLSALPRQTDTLSGAVLWKTDILPCRSSRSQKLAGVPRQISLLLRRQCFVQLTTTLPTTTTNHPSQTTHRGSPQRLRIKIEQHSFSALWLTGLDGWLVWQMWSALRWLPAHPPSCSVPNVMAT